MENWQFITTLIIVAAAAAYLFRRMVVVWSGQSAGCGSGAGACGKCPSANPKTDVVDLDLSFGSRDVT